MPEEKPKKPASRYSLKRRGGCELNHARHPKTGIPWCELCTREGRH